MIKDFLILNCIGKDDKIGLRIINNFYVHSFNQKVNNNRSFSALINNGPGSFSSIRASLAVAQGLKISKNINLYGYNNADLGQFSLVNIDILIKENLLQKNLIKPIYLS